MHTKRGREPSLIDNTTTSTVCNTPSCLALGTSNHLAMHACQRNARVPMTDTLLVQQVVQDASDISRKAEDETKTD